MDLVVARTSARVTSGVLNRQEDTLEDLEILHDLAYDSVSNTPRQSRRSFSAVAKDTVKSWAATRRSRSASGGRIEAAQVSGSLAQVTVATPSCTTVPASGQAITSVTSDRPLSSQALFSTPPSKITAGQARTSDTSDRPLSSRALSSTPPPEITNDVWAPPSASPFPARLEDTASFALASHRPVTPPRKILKSDFGPGRQVTYAWDTPPSQRKIQTLGEKSVIDLTRSPNATRAVPATDMAEASPTNAGPPAGSLNRPFATEKRITSEIPMMDCVVTAPYDAPLSCLADRASTRSQNEARHHIAQPAEAHPVHAAPKPMSHGLERPQTGLDRHQSLENIAVTSPALAIDSHPAVPPTGSASPPDRVRNASSITASRSLDRVGYLPSDRVIRQTMAFAMVSSDLFIEILTSHLKDKGTTTSEINAMRDSAIRTATALRDSTKDISDPQISITNTSADTVNLGSDARKIVSTPSVGEGPPDPRGRNHFQQQPVTSVLSTRTQFVDLGTDKQETSPNASIGEAPTTGLGQTHLQQRPVATFLAKSGSGDLQPSPQAHASPRPTDDEDRAGLPHAAFSALFAGVLAKQKDAQRAHELRLAAQEKRSGEGNSGRN